MQYYLYIKAVHVIFVVCWMAGIFYIVRLLIYHTEAQEKPEPERSILSTQYELMERRLMDIITTPSMILTFAAGITMLCLNPFLLQQNWMLVKLAFVLGLAAYHGICLGMMKKMRKGIYTWTSTQLRLWNEVATLFLFAIVFLVELKNAVDWIFGVVGLLLLTVLLMIGVKVYKYFRLKKK